MSYAPMVRTSEGGSFSGNGLRFETREEAQLWAKDLMNRWFLVREIRVDESSDPVNYSTVDGRTLIEVV